MAPVGHHLLSSGSMLDVEYAQLSHTSPHGDGQPCFASIVPKTEEQRRTHGWLFALADEVGSEKQSHHAAKLALESISSGFRSASPYELHRALLPRLIQQANAKLVQATSKSASIVLMACGFRSDCSVVCHVGDVRCYLIRRGHAELLTRDHTAANDFRRLGMAPDRKTDRSLSRLTLSRSLGTDEFVAVDVTERQIAAGDVLLACSYGFYSALQEIDVELIVSTNRDLNVAVRELVSAAEKNKEPSDSVSVQIMRVGEIEKESKKA